MMTNKTYVINSTNNRRLSEMGLIKGTTFRFVKKVAGMIQLKLNSNYDIVIREDMLKDVEYEKKIKKGLTCIRKML